MRKTPSKVTRNCPGVIQPEAQTTDFSGSPEVHTDLRSSAAYGAKSVAQFNRQGATSESLRLFPWDKREPVP